MARNLTFRKVIYERDAVFPPCRTRLSIITRRYSICDDYLYKNVII